MSQYWKDREAENLKRNKLTEEQYKAEVEKIYNRMQRDIQREIDSFYGRYADKEGISIAEAKKRVSKLDMDDYERKAKQYVKDRDFSDLANDEMRLYNLTMKVNRLEMLKSRIGLELIAGHDDLEKFMEEILKGRTIEELERQAGILGDSVLNAANLDKMVSSIVNASFHNANFSQRIWTNEAVMKTELDKLLKQGLIQGKGARELARSLRTLCGVSQRNAERLMITELARVQIEAQKLSYEENDFDEYEYIAEPTACPICKAMDGKHFKVAKMLPGENAAPMHPHCRCSTAPYSDRKEFDERLEHLEKGGTTEQWDRLKSSRKLGSNNESLGAIEPPKPVLVGHLDDLSELSIRKTLEDWESKIINQDFETAIIITNDGAIYRIDGDNNTVNINGLSDENLSGAWMTHNHPREETRYSFSAFDISEALRHKFALLRGTDESYNYEYKTTPETIDPGFDSIYNLFGEDYRNEAYEAVLRDEIDIDFDEYDFICKLLAKDYHFYYERTKRE